MNPTIQTFLRALQTPDTSLKSLTAARAATDAAGLPRLQRSTRFAEAEIVWRNGQWLLSMPLTSAALPRIERTVSRLRRLNTPWAGEYRILPGELRWEDAAGTARSTDLVMEALPAGCPFEQALLTEEKQTLLAALDTLERALDELHLRHNNLKASNLRWSAGRLVSLRWHDATFDTPGEADAAAFEALRRRIEAGDDVRLQLHDTTAGHAPVPRLSGHLHAGHLFEGLACVEDEAGFGYVDADNRPVIAAQYLWAGDFHEGRAEVETPTGMGLIDRRGGYVIPPRYEIVEYDPATSVSRVRQNGRWALFDYLGRRLTPFGPLPDEE